MTILSRKTVWEVQDTIRENVIFNGYTELDEVKDIFIIYGTVNDSNRTIKYGFSFSIRKDGMIIGFNMEETPLEYLGITQKEIFDFVISFGEQIGFHITK